LVEPVYTATDQIMHSKGRVAAIGSLTPAQPKNSGSIGDGSNPTCEGTVLTRTNHLTQYRLRPGPPLPFSELRYLPTHAEGVSAQLFNLFVLVLARGVLLVVRCGQRSVDRGGYRAPGMQDCVARRATASRGRWHLYGRVLFLCSNRDIDPGGCRLTGGHLSPRISPSRKMRARKPSHLGSKIQVSPSGRSSMRFASMGRIGGLTGRFTCSWYRSRGKQPKARVGQILVTMIPCDFVGQNQLQEGAYCQPPPRAPCSAVQ
jgi:hypothetical protein